MVDNALLAMTGRKRKRAGAAPSTGNMADVCARLGVGERFAHGFRLELGAAHRNLEKKRIVLLSFFVSVRT